MTINPDTMEIVRGIAKRVASIEIPVNRMRTHQRIPGDRKSIHRGEGDDFDGHDLYSYGDDPRLIDWNATALTGGQQVFISLFKEESHLKSTVICDVSPTMDFGSSRVSKRILAAELAAIAVKSLSNTHDPVGLVTYSDSGVERRVPSRPSASMILPTILNIIESKCTDRPGKHSGLAKSLALVPRSPSIVFVVSDFLNATEADWEALKRTGRRHQVYTFFVQDIREKQLPDAGWLPYLYSVQDHRGKRKDVWVTAKTRLLHEERFSAHEANVLQRLKDSHTRPLVVSTDQGDAAISSILGCLSQPFK